MPLLPWLRLLAPLAVAACGLYWILQAQVIEQEARLLAEQEKAILRAAGERLSQRLNDAAEDLRVMSLTPAVERYVESPTQDNRSLIEPLLKAFAEGKWVFRKLRLIEAPGAEVVRIERNAAGAQVLGANLMQDQSGRDYVEKALGYPPGMIHTTAFSLNESFGQVERPFQASLRMSMRLQSSTDKDYLLVADLRAAVLLKDLEETLLASRGEGWLIDESGYWILHPDPRMRWGAQLNPSNRIDEIHPELATALKSGLREEIPVGTARFFRVRLTPLQDSELQGQVAKSPRFEVLTHHRDFSSALPRPWAHLGWLIAAVALLAAASGLYVRTRARAERSEAESRALLERTSTENQRQTWLRSQLYQLSLTLSSCTHAPEMGQKTLQALAPQIGMAAGCIFSYSRDRATLLATYGAANIADLREFGSGEGLVGEVARTRQARHMTPPVAGYFDLSGGCGKAPAADLRVMPLEVHGHMVGVLEIALAEPLDERREELLREVLPLLALHLDGVLRSRRRTA